MNPEPRRLVGLVTNWKSNWGFAAAQDSLAYFIHQKSLRGGRKNLVAGQVVEFTPAPAPAYGNKAPVATDVHVIEEETKETEK